MRISVVVTTYNAAQQLDLVLHGMARQSRPADEVLVADDGSKDETAQVVAAHGANHVWHADKGFRKARIVNEAVRRSTGDHLVFLDGDSIPHRSWVEDHERAADGRRVLCGRRVKLGEEISRQVTPEWVKSGRLESLFGPVVRSCFGGGTSRMLLGIRLPQPLARLFHPRARKLMGVNFSLPRAVFEQVNGYDEAPGIGGREDKELEMRLQRLGAPFFPLLSRAVVYHLYHRPNESSEETRQWLAEQARSDRTRVEVGLDSKAFDPQT